MSAWLDHNGSKIERALMECKEYLLQLHFAIRLAAKVPRTDANSSAAKQ
jgi:hypothetical protein